MAESLTLTRDWIRLLFSLPTDAARVNVLRALADFAFDGITPYGLSEDEAKVFRPMKAKISHRRRSLKYLEKRQILTTPSNLDAFEVKPSNLDAPSNFDASPYINQHRKNNNIYLKKHTQNAPTREEVLTYSEELGRPEEAERFLDYHNANGWTCSNGRPLVDWRAAFRYWINGKGKRTKKPEKPKRDYTGI